VAERSYGDDQAADARPTVIGRELTSALYFTMAESNQPQTLIDGLLYVSPPPGEEHEEVVLAVAEGLAAFARERGGKVLVGRACWLNDETVIEPDVLYLSPERTQFAGRFVRGAPDLAVEVVSPGTAGFDTEAKFTAYGKNGVREAWFVDLRRESVTVVSGDGHAWQSERTVAFGEQIPSDLVDVGAANLARAEGDGRD